MDDEEEVLTTTFDVSLPAADFQLESSEEVIEHFIIVLKANSNTSCLFDSEFGQHHPNSSNV